MPSPKKKMTNEFLRIMQKNTRPEKVIINGHIMSSLHWIVPLSNCSFSYNGSYWGDQQLSIWEVIVGQKKYIGESYLSTSITIFIKAKTLNTILKSLKVSWSLTSKNWIFHQKNTNTKNALVFSDLRLWFRFLQIWLTLGP